MVLKNLLKISNYQSHNISKDLLISGISSDSRKIKKGDIFVAVKGFEFDGHDFIDQAVKKGAAAVIAENYGGKKDIPLILVDDSRKVRAEIAKRYYGNPAQGMDIFGVTGTNGKTSVCLLLDSILKAQGHKTGLLSTLYYYWDSVQYPAPNTTPDSLELYKYLADMKSKGVTSVVMEVSSHALSLHRVDGLQFTAAIFTNISRDHLEFHSSMDDYADAKSKLFALLRTEGVSVIYGDDYYASKMIKASNQRVVTFGENEQNDYYISEVNYAGDFSVFTLTSGQRKIRLETALKGNFNILNCTAAAVTGIELGYDLESVKTGIADITRVPGRMEYIKANQDFMVVVDYAHTPAAIGNILAEVRKFTPQRVIAVFGCGGDRDKGKRPLMGKMAAEYADLTVVTTDNPRNESPSAIISDIIKGIKNKKNRKIIEDRRKAIHFALGMAEKGDTVVILGKGHETYQEIRDRRIDFDDKKVVRDYLER